MDKNTLQQSAPVAARPAINYTPSTYQQAIFDEVSDPYGRNLIIEAVAGSGKTTTIVTAIGLIPHECSRIFLAFNKAIAEELRARGVPGSTFHALALNRLRAHLPRDFKIDGNKCSQIFRTIVAKDLQDDFSELPRLVGLGKNYGIGIFDGLPNIPANWTELIDYHDLTFPDNNKAAEFAIRILKLSNENTAVIDFDDMLYMNIMFNIVMDGYDYVFVDEAQDLNGIQLAILRKLTTPVTRFIFVGDSHQAIYGFRGAGSDSMDAIRREFVCVPLPLSVSYRCPTTVVEFAKRYVPQIEPAPGAPSGSVTTPSIWSANSLPPSSAVLCRNTKPLIALAYALMRDGRRVQVLGRDIGAGFKGLIKRAKATTIAQLRDKLCKMRDFDVEKERNRKAFRKAAAIEDRYDSLLEVIASLPDDSAAKVATDAVDALFAAQPGAIQLATVHKAKGLEWNDVFILDFERLMPSQYASDGWQMQQEFNLIYVAVTRTRKNLSFINASSRQEI